MALVVLTMVMVALGTFAEELVGVTVVDLEGVLVLSLQTLDPLGRILPLTHNILPPVWISKFPQ